LNVTAPRLEKATVESKYQAEDAVEEETPTASMNNFFAAIDL
jgi:hypothetical protein